MAIIGAAEIEVLPDTRRFASKAEADVTPQAEGLGRKIGTLIGGAVAVGGAFEFVKSSVEAFNEVQQATLKLDSALEKNKNTVGVTSEAFEGLNKHILNTTKFDDEAAKSVEAQLAQYNLTAKQIRELTPLVADYAARTGKDVVESAKLAGAAILGKGRALKDVGIAFKDLKDPTKNYTELVDGLRDKVGGFAEKEGKTFAGRLEILKNQFKEFEESVGQRLLPILGVLLGFFVNGLIPAVEAVAHAVTQWLAPVVQQVKWLAEAFVAAFSGEGITESHGIFNLVERLGVTLRSVVGAVRGFWDDFVGGFESAGAKLGPAIQGPERLFLEFGQTARRIADFLRDNWQPILGAVVVVFGLLTAPITTIVVGLALLYLRFEAVRDVVAAGFRFLSENLMPTLAALGALVALVVVPAVVSLAIAIGTALVGAVTALLSPVILIAAAVAALAFGIVWAYQHVQIFHDIVKAVADYFATSFVPQMQAVGVFIVAVWNEIYSVGKAVFDALDVVVRLFVDGPIKFLSDQVSAFSTWWSAHWDEIRAVFVFAFQAIGDFVAVWWQTTIAGFRVALDVIVPIVQVAWQELQAIFHVTFDLISGIVKVAWDYISGVFATARDLILGIVGVLLDLLTGKWGRAWSDIKSTVSNVLGDISGTIGKVLGDIVNTVGNLATDVFNAAKGIGHAIINGIVTGITNLVDDIGSAIKNVISSAIGHLPGPIKDAVHAVIGVFGEGGLVPGPVGQPQLAVVHGGEFVLSNDMLRGAKAAPVASAGGGARAGSVEVNVSIVMPGLATSPEAQALIRGVAQGEFASAMTKVLDRAAAGTGSRGG